MFKTISGISWRSECRFSLSFQCVMFAMTVRFTVWKPLPEVDSAVGVQNHCQIIANRLWYKCIEHGFGCALHLRFFRRGLSAARHRWVGGREKFTRTRELCLTPHLPYSISGLNFYFCVSEFIINIIVTIVTNLIQLNQVGSRFLSRTCYFFLWNIIQKYSSKQGF